MQFGMPTLVETKSLEDCAALCRELQLSFIELNNMHFHDASGSKNHLVLGTGEIDLNRYFKLAEKHGCRAVLETKTAEGLKRSVEYINAFVKRDDN